MQSAEEFRRTTHRGSIPIAKRGSNQYVAQTWRFFFYALILCAAGAASTIFLPLPLTAIPVLFAGLIASMLAYLLLHYVFKSYSKAFYAFLIFAALTGCLLGPQLALIAFTVQNGIFMICAAAAATIGMVMMIHNYAWVSASFNLKKISLFGAFLSSALTGLIIIGIVALIFPTPLSLLLYGAAGVALFSLYLTYDIYLLKIGAFKTPVQAAMNLFLDVINLFIDILRVFVAISDMKNKSNLKNIGEFFLKRILPIVGIVLIVLSLGFLEKWIMSFHGNDNDADASEQPEISYLPAEGPGPDPHEPAFPPPPNQGHGPDDNISQGQPGTAAQRKSQKFFPPAGTPEYQPAPPTNPTPGAPQAKSPTPTPSAPPPALFPDFDQANGFAGQDTTNQTPSIYPSLDQYKL